MDQQLLEMIREDLRELKSDVKLLIQYKNYSLGIIGGLTFVISLVFNFLMK